MTKCHYCGVESEIEEAFFKVPRSFNRKFRRVCVQCFEKRRTKGFKYQLGYWVVIAFVGSVFLFFPNTKSIGFFFLNCSLLDPFLLLTILPHEFGHALAGKLAGFRVFSVIAGSGRTIYKRRLLGFDLQLKPVPIGGVTILTPKSDKYFKLKYAFCIFAGPLVNLLFILALVLVMPRPIWPHGKFPEIEEFKGNIFVFITPFVAQKLLPLQMMLVANIWVLVWNLWPRHINSVAGRIANDGLALLKIPFMKREKIDHLLMATYAHEALEARQERRFPEAQQWCEKGLAKYPGNETLVNVLGVSLLNQGLFKEARHLFYERIQMQIKDPAQNALILNNLAYTDIMLGDPELLTEADTCSKQAMEKLSWMPSIKGTRGAVLIELGQIQQGVVLLQEAMQNHEDAAQKAENACFIALGERKRGNLEEFQRYLELAKTLNPNSSLLKRVQQHEPKVCSGT